MTISSATRQAGPYNGNGSTTAFPFAFKVFQTADVQVVYTNNAGVESTWVMGVNYTVTLNGDQNANPGGTVTAITAPATGTKVTITSTLAALQGTDLTNLGGFFPEVVTNAFDYLTILVQQILNLLSRTVRMPISDGIVSTTLPTAAVRANTALGFDANGNFTVYGINITANGILENYWTNAAGTTIFKPSFAYVPGTNALWVYKNGAKLINGVDYTETDSATVTLAVALAQNSDKLEILAGQQTVVGTAVPGAQIVDGSITATKYQNGSVLANKVGTAAVDVVIGQTSGAAGPAVEIPFTAAARTFATKTSAANMLSWLGGAISGLLTASGLTINTARLAGRTTAGQGAVEEIAPGNGLTLSAGVLDTPTGSVIQRVFQTYTTVAVNNTSQITPNGSAPTTANGVQIFSVAFVPKQSTSTIVIRGIMQVGDSAAPGAVCAAIFSGTTFLTGSMVTVGGNGSTAPLEFMWQESAVSTASRTYSVNYGPAGATTASINSGQFNNTTNFGANGMISWLEILELKA